MSFRRRGPCANNQSILEHWHTTFSKCRTTFIKPRLGLTESLIQLRLACHNILTALSSANLFSHRECYWRLFTSVKCRIPRDFPGGSTNLNVSNSGCTQLLFRCLLLSKSEHFKLARQNRWLQHISASSLTSHAISFKLPSVVSPHLAHADVFLLYREFQAHEASLHSKCFVFTQSGGTSSSGGEQSIIWLPHIYLPSAERRTQTQRGHKKDSPE